MARKHLILRPIDWIRVGEMIDDIHGGRLTLPTNEEQDRNQRLSILQDYSVERVMRGGQPIVKDVHFHQSTEDLMHVMIAPKQPFLDAKDEAGQGSYAVHEHYVNYVNNLPGRLDPPRMFLFEVGQYTLGHCGGG